MKLLTKLKNWWNPFGYEEESNINTYEFIPDNSITAYQLYMCREFMIIIRTFMTPQEVQQEINRKYSEIPDDCKKYFMPVTRKFTFYKHYE